MRAQLGLLSNEIEIEPNLFWRRHVDQIEDYNVPVADSYTPIIQPLPFPPPVENHGDLVAEPSEQTEVVLRETDCQPSKPAAEFFVRRARLNLFLLDDTLPESKSPQLGWTFEL